MTTSTLSGGLGVLFLVITAYSLASGRTGSKQSRGWIYREEEPGKYWSAVISYAIAALLFFAVAWHFRVPV